MMRLLIISSFCILFLAQLASPIDIRCDYHNRIEWSDHFQKVYQCDIVNWNLRITNRGETVTSVSEDHMHAYTVDQVNALHMIDRVIYYLPTGFEKFFESLIGLSVMRCGLKEITQSDLKVFPKLQHLWLKSNDLTVLEKDLFKNNPELNYIGLDGNRLSRIDPAVFDDIEPLHRLSLLSNECIDMCTTFDELDDVIYEVKRSCGLDRTSTTTEHPTTYTWETDWTTTPRRARLDTTTTTPYTTNSPATTMTYTTTTRPHTTTSVTSTTTKSTTSTTQANRVDADEAEFSKWFYVGCGFFGSLIVMGMMVAFVFYRRRGGLESMNILRELS